MPKTKTKEAKLKRVSAASSLTINVYNLDGRQVKTMELPRELFKVSISPKLLAQYVRVYLANQRQGTVATKTRGEVVGSTRKIYRQKGTGRARHGDIKAPIFVGGGVAHGPKPRDYSLALTKKQRRKALVGALTLKLKEGNILALSSTALKITPKTKIMAKFLDSLKLYSKKILFILPKIEKSNLRRAGQNIPKISFIDVASLNAYKILSEDKIIFLEDVLPVLQNHFAKNEN